MVGVAEPTIGHVLCLCANLKATFTTVDGAPIRALPIRFRTQQSSQFLCDAITNPEGVAYCVASFTGNALQPIDGFVAGYNAIFDGNPQYQPASAHSTATPFL